MIIQIPRGTSIVLRFDGHEVDDADPSQTITLLAGSEPAVPGAIPSQSSAPRSSGFRRRTMLACGAVGLVVAAVGVTFLNTSPHADPTLNLPHQTASDDSRPAMPDRMRAELAQGPTVIPPTEAAPPAAAPGQLVGAPPRNAFGLE